MYSTELKIKRKTLAVESRFIRQEEEKWREEGRKARLRQKIERAARSSAKFDTLYWHRKNVVRPEARASGLAHAFLKGMPYQQVEQKFYKSSFGYGTIAYLGEAKLWERVVDIVTKFGNLTADDDPTTMVRAWRDEHALYKESVFGDEAHGLLNPEQKKRSERTRRTKEEWLASVSQIGSED